MKKPIIGIGGTFEQAPPSSAFPLFRRVFTNEGYLSKLLEAGALPILLPVAWEYEVEQLVNLCDGIVLPGGPDIDPSCYGQEHTELCSPSDCDTDRFQLSLYREARRQGKPVLGICRGAQLINVAHGGTLFQDYRLRRQATIKHPDLEHWDAYSHNVTISDGSRLYECFACSRLGVNSLHHQSVDRLGCDLVISAVSDDGSVEAIETTQGPWCVGVQWHPESMEGMQSLFSTFLKEAGT
ncbi:MAG: gamma-glutamyl-gamma-aminobutyrate hydrolase family protein [Sphaerochaeta sp.]|jgi:putative glutamine amidotransferase|uniref:gamma-glutamyl-gamma-aminobutyrate hydrolase family protein n=1 Tax=Sphaerochaeta sp. TaxID=1972642 RepID=UPI003D097AC9